MVFRKEARNLKKVYKGVVEDNVIRFKEKISLPVGTEALVTLRTVKKEEQKEIKE